MPARGLPHVEVISPGFITSGRNEVGVEDGQSLPSESRLGSL
jgi:hypothetical protein